jgi:hypothetical protein
LGAETEKAVSAGERPGAGRAVVLDYESFVGSRGEVRDCKGRCRQDESKDGLGRTCISTCLF